MADLSDEDLTTIIATVTGDQSDLSGDARFEAMRAAIAADRALNAAPSVGAGGLPLQAAFETWAADQGCHLARTVQGDDYQDLRTQIAWDSWQACAALASRPAVDAWQPIETAPRTSRAILVWCPERRNVYAVSWYGPSADDWVHFGGRGGALHEVPSHWMPLPAAPDVARHPAQRENT